jgi:L-2-amino-thiazoline-4-carboxylic acid hydrolase
MADTDNPSGLQFPARSHRSTDQVFTWDEVKAIMDKEITRRAEYVTTIILAMKERFGDEAYQVAAQAIYNIGYRKGQARAALVQEQGKANDLESLSELIAHKMSRLYLGTTTEVQPGELTVCETYCPLPVYWKSAGLPDAENVRFCKIFDQVDKGMVEGYNPSFAAELGGAEELATKGYCHMVVRQR